MLPQPFEVIVRYLTPALTLMAVAFATTAHAQEDPSPYNTCGVENPDDLQDTFYHFFTPPCDDAFLDDTWDRYSFSGYWDDYGKGQDHPCGILSPHGRTMSALKLLAFAGTSSPHCDYEVDNTLTWAYCFSGDWIDELIPVCEAPPATSNIATTYPTALLDQHTDLHRAFFYNNTVTWRAASIFHEARHAEDDCFHVDCAAGAKSCDQAYDHGCPGGDGQGAYTYTAVWLQWFYVAAQAHQTDEQISRTALFQANVTLGRNFVADPCFRMQADGTVVMGLDENGNPIAGC
jgi:hypothetical protein